MYIYIHIYVYMFRNLRKHNGICVCAKVQCAVGRVAEYRQCVCERETDTYPRVCVCEREGIICAYHRLTLPYRHVLDIWQPVRDHNVGGYYNLHYS